MWSVSTYLSFFNYINQLMKKMASSYYDFQGPYVLGSLAGFPLGPWFQWTTGQASVGEHAPSLLHPEAELQEGTGKNGSTDPRRGNQWKKSRLLIQHSKPLSSIVPSTHVYRPGLIDFLQATHACFSGHTHISDISSTRKASSHQSGVQGRPGSHLLPCAL